MTAAPAWLRLMNGLCDCGRLMVGVTSYDDYVLHAQARHPDVPPMTRAEFVADRQAARFGGGGRGGFRCC